MFWGPTKTIWGLGVTPRLIKISKAGIYPSLLSRSDDCLLVMINSGEERNCLLSKSLT